MKKLIINLSDNDYNYVRKDIKGWYGLNPTIPQLKKMLKGETAILAGIATQPYLKSGLDTILREDVLDILTHKLVGTSWPSNCTSKRNKKIFFNKLTQKAKEAHIEIGIDEDYLD